MSYRSLIAGFDFRYFYDLSLFCSLSQRLQQCRLTTDNYFIDPYKQYPVLICGQRVILTNGNLAEALSSLPEKKREIIYLYFVWALHTTGNRGTIRVLPEYGVASHTQCLAKAA